jgi:hypothetical protein
MLQALLSPLDIAFQDPLLQLRVLKKLIKKGLLMIEV